MSVGQTSKPDQNPKMMRLANYLKEEASNGDMYVKSKYIADEVGLSAKEIGALMLKLSQSNTTLCIEKWSNSRATTWRVSV